MLKPRQFYIYIVCAISIQAVTWALITLVRNFLITSNTADPLLIALQISIIIIMLPIFVAHWLWAQRLASKSDEERDSIIRRIYLYGMMSIFLGSFVGNAFSLIKSIVFVITGESIQYRYRALNSNDQILFALVPLLILPFLFYFHQRVLIADTRGAEQDGLNAVVRRLYVYGFSSAGLSMTILGIIYLTRWIMFQFGKQIANQFNAPLLSEEIARLIVGVTLWLIFWSWAQRLFAGSNPEEHISALRKFYLYGTIFIGALGVTINLTGMLASGIEQLLGVRSTGLGTDIRIPISSIIGLSLLWSYHAYVLRKDAKKTTETSQQAGIERLYLYLVAGIGLTALLIGICGDLSVLLRSFTENFGQALKQELAMFTAAVLAGLPVWLIPWRRLQLRVTESTTIAEEERSSLVRKIYVYFFILVSTLLAVSSAVYIVFKIISMFFGEGSPSISDIGQPLAYIIVAATVWVYHGFILRQDQKLSQLTLQDKYANLKVMILDTGEDQFAHSLLFALQKELPKVTIKPVIVSELLDLSEAEQFPEAIIQEIQTAGLLIGSSSLMLTNGGNRSKDTVLSQVVLENKGHKLIIPEFTPGWDWVGVDHENEKTKVNQTVQSVKQFIEGKEVKPRRSIGAGAIVGIVLAALIILFILFQIFSRILFM